MSIEIKVKEHKKRRMSIKLVDVNIFHIMSCFQYTFQGSSSKIDRRREKSCMPFLFMIYMSMEKCDF